MNRYIDELLNAPEPSAADYRATVEDWLAAWPQARAALVALLELQGIEPDWTHLARPDRGIAWVTRLLDRVAGDTERQP